MGAENERLIENGTESGNGGRPRMGLAAQMLWLMLSGREDLEAALRELAIPEAS